MHRTPVPDDMKRAKASQPQLNFIRGLRDERDLSSLTEAQRTFLFNEDNLVEETTKLWRVGDKSASEIITKLQGLDHKPRAARASSQFPDVPAGRYAVEHDGVLKFYSVDRPKEGRWAGFTFLNVWASDERHPIKNVEYKKEVLGMIANDPQAAAERFGQEIGACAICGRTLTDPTSRAIGIGPICRDGVGWYG